MDTARPACPKPDWTRVHHVLLDMDGTLLDLAFDNFLWCELIPARYATARGLTRMQAQIQLGPQFVGVAHTLAFYDTDHWSRITGLDVAALHHEFRNRITILDGSLSFLEAARASGRPLWLTTNAHPDSWRPKLEQTGIAHYFQHIVSSHDMQAPKEDARFWQRLRQRHPFDPAHALFADDSRPVLESARRFGIGQIVAMNHPDTSQPPRRFEDFYSVARLDELLPLPGLTADADQARSP
ncbi:MAG: GMP/IMP nucleotidase [Panacagrimonas sp.]